MDASPINPTTVAAADMASSSSAIVATPLDRVPEFLLWDMYFGAYVALGPDVVANATNISEVVKVLWPLIESRRYSSYLTQELEMAVAHPNKIFTDMDLAMRSPNLALAFSLDPNTTSWTTLARIIAMSNPSYAHILPQWKPNFFRLYGEGAKRFIVGSATFRLDCMAEFKATDISRDALGRYSSMWTTKPMDGDVLQFVAGDITAGDNTFFFDKGGLVAPKMVNGEVVIPFTAGGDFPMLHYDRVLPANWLLQLDENVLVEARDNIRGLDDPETPLFIKETIGEGEQYTFFRDQEITWNIVCIDNAAGRLNDVLAGEVYVQMVPDKGVGDDRFLLCKSVVPIQVEEPVQSIMQPFQSLTMSDANFGFQQPSQSQPVQPAQQPPSPYSFDFGGPSTQQASFSPAPATQAPTFQMQNFGSEIVDPFANMTAQQTQQQQTQYPQANAYQQPTSFGFTGFGMEPQAQQQPQYQQYPQQNQYTQQQPQYQQAQFPGAPSFLNQFPQGGPQMQMAQSFGDNGLVVM